jgi:hypothetical protein
MIAIAWQVASGEKARLMTKMRHTGCPVKIRLSSFKYNFFGDRTIFKNLILK